MIRKRLFADLIDLEVYLVYTRLSSNDHDVVCTYEVNGLTFELVVSGSIITQMESLRSDIVRGNDGRRFYTEAERAAKQTEFDKIWKQITEYSAYTLQDAYRSRQEKELS